MFGTKKTILVGLSVSVLAFGCDTTKQIDTRAQAQGSTSAGAAGKDYRVVVPSETLKSGEKSSPEIVVEPGSGFKINLEYPWNVQLKEPTNASVGTAQLKRGEGIELTEEKARFPIEITPGAAGDVEVTAIANFSVCNDDVCKNFRDEEITLSFKATDNQAP